MDESSTSPGWRALLALFLTCASIYLWTAPGRIQFPDDEIVFQTTERLYLDGTLAIPGIPKRTGEPRDRPDGTFGWALGVDGRRYGFFGHGLSIAALPAYALADATFDHVPHTWAHAVRSDHFVFHARSPRGDWTRLVVSLTNCLLTAASACALALWIAALGLGRRAALLTGLAYALGTAAWAYSRTFLSEPLSALTLLCGAWLVARFHQTRAPWRLWAAGLVCGLSAHVHLLNVIALPCFVGYALLPLTPGERRRSRAAIVGALALGAVALAALLVDQHLRFGSPFETGRYDHYSRYVAPLEGIVAQLVGPGRSVFVYAPAALVGLWGLRAARRRVPAALWFGLSLLAARLLFVACRSDWWGGWGVGPRYLAPAIPFMLVPLAALLADWPQRGRATRASAALCLALATLLSGHLGTHSIFEWMWRLTLREPVVFMDVSHWRAYASPIVGFLEINPDMLSIGARKLHALGHPSLWWLFLAIAAIGAVACAGLIRAVGRGDARRPSRSP
ncbi:MAG: hypothetical protein KC636_09535 [Myxococcales bacterium]|nr:hypothetical protein [Myxococcales bacterium]